MHGCPDSKNKGEEGTEKTKTFVLQIFFSGLKRIREACDRVHIIY